jgi:hypothetical protein
MRHHIHPLRDTARELTLVNAAANSGRASQRRSPGQPALRDTAATVLDDITLNSFSDLTCAAPNML